MCVSNKEQKHLGQEDPRYMKANSLYVVDYKIIPPIANANATERAIATVPGIINGWLNTALPIRVDPVSSISTAAINVGYVGRMKSALTAANDATTVNGDTPRAIALGINAFAVAACE